MSVNLAALHDAAEALARACQDADAGHLFDAAFAAERSSLCAQTAFDAGSSEGQAWNTVLGVIAAELSAGYVTVVGYPEPDRGPLQVLSSRGRVS